METYGCGTLHPQQMAVHSCQIIVDAPGVKLALVHRPLRQALDGSIRVAASPGICKALLCINTLAAVVACIHHTLMLCGSVLAICAEHVSSRAITGLSSTAVRVLLW